MKKILISILALFSIHNSFSQTKFEKKDSIPKTKDQIYSDTKIFIAGYWNSAQHVIQNDDRENGIIIVKGSFDIFMLVALNTHKFTYSYSVKFLMKDSIYKIIVYDCINTSRTVGIYSHNAYLINPDAKFESYSKNYITEDKWNQIQGEIRLQMNSIISDYGSNIIKESNTNW